MCAIHTHVHTRAKCECKTHKKETNGNINAGMSFVFGQAIPNLQMLNIQAITSELLVATANLQ